jgi:hypothetical protein
MNRTDVILSRFPQFYQSRDTKNALYSFIEAFAQQLDEAEEALLRVMHAHWVQTADNELPKKPLQQRKGDLDKIFALYLEKLGATALLQQTNRNAADPALAASEDELYRQRVLSLIRVLKDSPITKQGIQNIVAANLGIADDMAYADEAKAQIQIVEFLPKIIDSEQDTENQQIVPLFSNFTFRNQSQVETVPVFRLSILEAGHPPPAAFFDVKIKEVKSSNFVQYQGEVRAGDTLIFLSEGAMLNGVKVPTTTEGSMRLPPGDSTFQIEADWGIAGQKYAIARFDDAHPIALDNTVFTNGERFASVELSYQKLQYGTFSVVLPWDIPGFSTYIKITQATLDRLKILNVPQPYLDGVEKLKKTEKGTTYETLKAFYDAFDAVPEWAQLPKESKERRDWIRLLLQEARLKDKYAGFKINPRHQIAEIVERVKAAGVYSEVVFEKRFVEHQQLEDRFDWTKSEIPVVKVPLNESLESADTLNLSAVFDFTYFDSQNGFA